MFMTVMSSYNGSYHYEVRVSEYLNYVLFYLHYNSVVFPPVCLQRSKRTEFKVLIEGKPCNQEI